MQVRPSPPGGVCFWVRDTDTASGATHSAGSRPPASKTVDPWLSGTRWQVPSAPPIPQAPPVQVIRTQLNPQAKPETKTQATSPNKLYGLSYNVPVPVGGLRSLTFPMAINRSEQRKGPQDAGDFFAMQFDVNDVNGKPVGGGYIGLQPREDGKALVVFSGFGTHFSPVKGRSEADGGPGASSSATIDFQFGHKYELTVERDSRDPRLLRAFVQDVSNADWAAPRQHVQDLRVDQDVVLAGQKGGFIEHYGKAISKSSDIGRAECVFHAPFGRSARGRRVDGTLAQGELGGRFSASTTGRRVVAIQGNKITAVRVLLWGAR